MLLEHPLHLVDRVGRYFAAFLFEGSGAVEGGEECGLGDGGAVAVQEHLFLWLRLRWLLLRFWCWRLLRRGALCLCLHLRGRLWRRHALDWRRHVHCVVLAVLFAEVASRLLVVSSYAMSQEVRARWASAVSASAITILQLADCARVQEECNNAIQSVGD